VGQGVWRRKPGFRIVSVEQARRETGLSLAQLLQISGAELLTRVLPDGRREEAIRLPVEPPDEEPSGPGSST
jgi:hypothetical protein